MHSKECAVKFAVSSIAVAVIIATTQYPQQMARLS